MQRCRMLPIIVASAVVVTAALLFLGMRGSAQQAAPSRQTIRSTVPDNPSPHPAPEQPIPYSHKQHLAFGLACKDCHVNPEPGKLMTYPDTARCMQCHVTIAKDKPSIQKLTEYSKSNQPVPWVRVYKVLPGIAWTHRAHLGAGVKCESCHGQVREMATMSEATSVITMSVCLTCHEQNHAKSACETCHKN